MKTLQFRKYSDINALCYFVNSTWQIVHDSIEVVSITRNWWGTYTLFYYAT